MTDQERANIFIQLMKETTMVAVELGEDGMRSMSKLMVRWTAERLEPTQGDADLVSMVRDAVDEASHTSSISLASVLNKEHILTILADNGYVVCAGHKELNAKVNCRQNEVTGVYYCNRSGD